MRTNANSCSLRCGQAFICHALAAVCSRGQYGTYATRRLRASYLTSNSSFSSATSACRPPLANPASPRLPYPFEFPRDLGDRVPCHNYLPPSSPAGTFVRGLHRRRRRRRHKPLSTFLLIMQPCASTALTIRQRATLRFVSPYRVVLRRGFLHFSRCKEIAKRDSSM